MTKFTYPILAAACIAAMTACSDDPDQPVPTPDPDPTPVTPQKVAVTVNVTMPEGVTAVSDEKLTFTNVTTQTSEDFTSTASISLLPGLYDLSYSATTELHDGVTADVRASERSITVKEGSTINLSAFVNVASDDLIISEIYFSGCLTPSAYQYSGDNYVKLYNNTDHVIYADRIALFETTFMSVQKFEYTPDIRDTHVAVDAVYVIPGSGNEHPIQPGEYMVLADNAMDHRELNPNSIDLSHAAFEWYDESMNPAFTDIDNPAVANLDKWFCSSNTMFALHNRGYKSYGIARIPDDYDMDRYLSELAYSYTYKLSVPAGVFEIPGDTYSMPNDWVVDMVNLSVDALFAWTVTAPSLDMGWTHCGTIDMDPDRYFHSVRRKYLATADDGRIILKDTNNSTDDFNPNVIASEIELQGAATTLDGTKCSQNTIDGITPAQ